MSEPVQTSLALTMRADRMGEFFPILQQGFSVTARVGCTLEKLLAEEWGLSPEYVAKRITTIFLNSRAIDDVATAHVNDGAAIALSGAMPGLVGATMRRGGYYAAMRGSMTYRETGTGDCDRLGTVRVKLFNLLLPELGPAFLRRGVLIDAAEATAFLRERDASFWSGCEDAVLDGTPLAPERLRTENLLPDAGMVLLSVILRG